MKKPSNPFTRERVDKWKLYSKFTLKDIIQQRMNFALGFLSIFIVVITTTVSMTLVENSPAIFLGLAEMQEGEIDFLIRSSTLSGNSQLNSSKIREIQENKEYPEFSGRIWIKADYSNVDNCDLEQGTKGWDWAYEGSPKGDSCSNSTTSIINNCLQSYCEEIKPIIIYWLDPDQEEKIELGREDDIELGEGEAIVTEFVNVEPGDTIIVRFDISDRIPSIAQEAMTIVQNDPIEIPQEWCVFNMPFRVVNKSRLVGKFPSGVRDQDLAIINIKKVAKMLSNYANPNSTQEYRDALKEVIIPNLIDDLVWNVEPPRLESYNSNRYELIQDKIISLLQKILYVLGFNSIDIELDILRNLRQNRFSSMFLSLILNIIVSILVTLSVILIYSLLLISVETRTFEFGVFRTLGIDQSGLIQMVLIQGCMYAIPSWILGLSTSAIIFQFVARYFSGLLGFDINHSLDPTAIFIATILAFMIPIISSYYPIKAALSKSLQTSLDIKRSKTSAVVFKLTRTQDNFSWGVIGIGFGFALFGFCVYYFFPLSLLSMNVSLLLYIFFGILIGMLLGLVLLSINLEYPLERLISILFLFWKKPVIRFLVLKNLVAHRVRNRKTTILYSLSLGFIIFITVSFSLQIKQIEYRIRQDVGTDGVRFEAPFWLIEGKPATIESLGDMIKIAKKSKHVKNYATTSTSLSNSLRYESTTISNRGYYFEYGCDITAISPSFYDVTINEFLSIKESKEFFGILPISEQLYTVRGSSSSLIGSLYQDQLYIFNEEIFLLNAGSNVTRMRYQAILDASPMFSFSKLPSVSFQDVLVSYPTFVTLSDKYQSVEDVPIDSFLVSFKEETSKEDKEEVIQEMVNTALGGNLPDVMIYEDIVKPFNTAAQVLRAFAVASVIISNVICFFALISSTYVNIRESSKETAILRAIGIQKNDMNFINCAESFILVVASSMLGFLIGMIVAYTMFQQNILFSGFEIPFVFDYVLILSVIIISFVFSVIAAYIPSKRLMKEKIVNLFRLR